MARSTKPRFTLRHLKLSVVNGGLKWRFDAVKFRSFLVARDGRVYDYTYSRDAGCVLRRIE